MYYQRIYLIIFGFILLVPIAFFTTYLIAVLNKHVLPGFPYISDTGTLPPESCVFGQFFAVESFLLFLIVYIRYHHVRLVIQKKKNKFRWFNVAAYILGLLSSLGMSLVGNFQVTNVITVHLIGAGLAFIGSFFYLIMQTFLSHKLSSVLHSTKFIFIFRIFLIVLLFALLLICPIVGSVGSNKLLDGAKKLLWTHKDGGYVEHIVSTSTEWTYTFVLMIFLLTFYCDFKRIKIKHPVIEDATLENELAK